MAQLESYRQQLAARSASLVYVAAEKRNGIFKPEDYLRKHPVSFPFLLDEDRAVAKSWGVYQRIGLDAYNIARAATFVVGTDGVLRYAYIGRNQHDRAPMEAVLAAV